MSRCDYAACRDTSTTTSPEGWNFCPTHTESDAALRAGQDPAPETAPASLLPIIRKDKAMTTPTTPPSIATLLENAGDHGSAKVRRLGARIETLLDDLRAAVKAAEAEEGARKEIARLERMLADAKAKLRGTPPQPRAASPAPAGGFPCRKGCGQTSAAAAGRGMHEKHCAAEAAA